MLPTKKKKKKSRLHSHDCMRHFFHPVHAPLSCGSVAWILPGPLGFPRRGLKGHGSRRRWKKSQRFCFSSLPEVVVLGWQPSPIIADTGSIIRPCRQWFNAEAEMRSAVGTPDRLHTLCNASCYAASSSGLLSETRLHYLGDFAGHVCHTISVKVANTRCGSGTKKAMLMSLWLLSFFEILNRLFLRTEFRVPESPRRCSVCGQGVTRDPSLGSLLTVWGFLLCSKANVLKLALGVIKVIGPFCLWMTLTLLRMAVSCKSIKL